jgi:tetratricopeptide (TPR) repeat protein
MLRANGRKVEAEAALRAATRADPMFAEAWYNLSDLLDGQGKSEAAIDCLRRALHAAPEYADAIFNLAVASAKQQARGGRGVLAALSCQ